MIDLGKKILMLKPQTPSARTIGATIVLLLIIILTSLLAYVHYYETSVRVVKPNINKTPTVSRQMQPPLASSPTPISKTLFFDALNGPDRIVTNEFTHWSARGRCPYTSSEWDMTSGTLFIKNGAGYSGVPTLETESICNSSVKNNSSIFRLNTKSNKYKNVVVSMDYKSVEHGGGGAPNNSYDGIHIWVGYQSEYALYSTSIYRWDGIIVIKKKVPQQIANCSDPSNDGCYYNLSKELKRSDITTADVWHHTDVTYSVDPQHLTHIDLKIDGVDLMNATDTDTHGASYQGGAVGVRGDNTEFYFKNFMITSL